MGLILNGNAPSKMLYNGAEVSLYFNGSKIWPLGPDPYNPLGLPPNTVRVRTKDGNAPSKYPWASETTYETATLVQGTTDVYDVYKSGTDFSKLLFYGENVKEVLGANTTGITNMYSMFGACTKLTTVQLFDTSSVTNMSSMFASCSSLTSVPLFNTSNVTNMSSMFNGCTLTTIPLFNTSKVTNMSGMFSYSNLTIVPLFNTSNVTNMSSMFSGCYYLTTIPLFDTSKVTNMNSMFWNCIKVQSGALALYQQASTQATPPSNHTSTFSNCGRDTDTGAAELAQIPDDWK
jgi:surface protein